MTSWREIALGDACELYQPPTISTAQLVDDGPYEVYGANGVIGRYHSYNHEEPQLLVTCRGATCGTVNRTGPKVWINGNAMVVRPRSNDIDMNYLEHLLRGGVDLSAAITGAAQPQITRQSLAPIRAKFPPLPEQRRIATILDQADALRAKRREALALLDELQRGIFIEMFGDPAHNTKGLPLIALGEAGTWQSGGTPPRTQEHYFDGEIPWFSSGELESMYVRESIERITSDAMAETSAKLVKKGSLMLGMYDTAALKASISGVDCSCNQAISFSSLERGLLDIVYAYYAIVIGREHFRRLQRGVRQKNLNLEMIRGIKIPFPSIESQREFAARTSLMTSQGISLTRSLGQLDALFHSLQHRAFRGEL